MPELIAQNTAAVADPGAAVTTPAAATTSTTPTDAAAGPKSVKIDYEGDGQAIDLALEDAAPAGKSDEFTFSSLDPIKDTHADLYKTLKSELSRGSRYSKHFKTPEELSSYVSRVDRMAKNIGNGKEGLEAIESALTEAGSTLYRLQSGDKATVEQWVKDNPEGMAELVSNALPGLDQKFTSGLHSKGAWSRLTQKDASGQSAVDALNALYTQIPADKPELKRLIERAAFTLNEIYQDSNYKPDPTKALERQRTELAQRESRIWNQETDTAALDLLRPVAGKALAALTTEIKGLSSEDRAEYRQFLTTEWFKAAGKDSSFVSRLNELRKTNDRAGILDLVKSNRVKFMNEAAKALYRQKLLNRDSIRAEASGKAEAGTGAATTAARVSTKWTGRLRGDGSPVADYDFSRMNAEGIEAMDRLFYVKGDKRLFTW